MLSTYSSDTEPLGTTLIRCGNRRASECPSCSRVYAADMFHLIKAGVAGGKGVPERVGENPLVFATVTAPSFGHVHGMRDNGRRCRPHAKAKRCEHGRPTTCMAQHEDGDELLGQPLCWECYDYASHIVWQWWAPELWRRFNIGIKRALAHRLGVKESRLKDVACVQYSKVAEYQRRGLIHFHALVRLDGPKTDDAFAPAPDGVTAQLLAEVVEEAVRSVRFTAPPVFAGDVPRVLAFGAQVDSRPVKVGHRTDDPDGPLNAEQVAGYLAKYSTKSATDTTTGEASNPHLSRIQAVAAEFATLVEDEWVADRMPCDAERAAVRAARQVAHRPRVPRPLRDQVAPLLRHPRRPAPCPSTRPGPHRRRATHRHTRRPRLDGSPAARRRRGRNHARRRVLVLRRDRVGHRRRRRTRPRSCRSGSRVRPTPGRAEASKGIRRDEEGRPMTVEEMPPRERLMNVREVADYLGVCARTVWSLRAEGKFAPGRRSARRWCGGSPCCASGWSSPRRARESRPPTSSGAPDERLPDSERQVLAGVLEVPRAIGTLGPSRGVRTPSGG